MSNPVCDSTWGEPGGAGPPRDGAALHCYIFLAIRTFTELLVLLLANFLASAFTSQRSFYTFFLARFEVKGVALDLLDNVLLLHFALEAAQSVLEGFTLLQPNFRQTDTPPNPSCRTHTVMPRILP